MHDSVLRVFRRLPGHRRLAEGHHVELAVEYFRVKAHRVGAVAVEGQIGNGLWHGRFLCVVTGRPDTLVDCILIRRMADAQSDRSIKTFYAPQGHCDSLSVRPTHGFSPIASRAGLVLGNVSGRNTKLTGCHSDTTMKFGQEVSCSIKRSW